MLERIIERLLYASRWLLAPVYLALSLVLIALGLKFFQEIYHLFAHIMEMSESDMVLRILGLIDLSLVGEQPPGTWLLTFLGAAREVIDADRAAAINNALAALDAAMAGDHARIDALFADLVDREPSLPDHLKDLS